ncbi:MAG: type I 3-dehydroquinate dehydratase [Lachnospiraceae bacterium]|jgi:3-dehydroquinate dehydratase-1
MNRLRIDKLVLGEGIPKICVPIVGRCEAEILQEVAAVRDAKPDLAEWRVDFYEKADDVHAVEEMLSCLKDELDEIPFLFTFRTKAEGGNRSITPEDYCRLNRMAAESQKPVLIDVEIDVPGSDDLIGNIHESGGLVIASHHNFLCTPTDGFMKEKLHEMEEKGADVLKLAVMPQSEMDVLRLLQVTVQMRDQSEKPIVTMSMSSLGVISRISGILTGSALTFASLGAASAPGQIPLQEMKELLSQMELYGK